MSEDRQKTALITGASSGIGFQVAKQLAQKGWKVYAGARRTELMEPLKEYGVVPVKLDVASVESCSELKIFLSNELKDGKLDVLYNNAGVSCTAPAIDVSEERLEQCIHVNVLAPARLVRELQEFIINAKGTILFTGSLSGLVPFPFSAVYSASKAAIHAYARGLHIEMKGFDVRVINIITGGVATDIADKAPIPPGSKFDCEEFRSAFDDRREMAKRNHPMSAEDYASQVIKDIESTRDPIDVYRGKHALSLGYLSYYLPGWLAEIGLSMKFKLYPIFEALRKRYSGDDTHLD